MEMKKILLFLALISPLTFHHSPCQVSPFDYGLREAEDGVGRYWALYNAHVAALEQGVTVNYDSIDTLELELPADFKTIPLGRHTDFDGLVLYVTNNVKHGALFSMSTASTPLELDKALVDGRQFDSVPELAEGWHLLVLNDKKPWTERRGYGYQQYRADIMVVEDGRGINAPIAPWNTDSTQLSASYINIDTAAKSFRNLTMHRTKNSTFKTYCLSVSGQYNVWIENIHVTTPKSKMIADGVFSVRNSARINFFDVTVDGTYSGYGSTRDYGYAFSMNNVWFAHFQRVKAHGNWGVFGTNNMSNTQLFDCDLDRFDIHCYGRDAWLVRCTLRQRQTQFSSMFGTVAFDSCNFIDCIPVRIRSSYNAYTPFDIVMRDCTFELTPRYHSLVNVMLLDTADNPRPELKEKCWPNLNVINMTVVVPWTVGALNLFHPTGTMKELRREFGYISEVDVFDLNMVRPNGGKVKIPVRLSSRKFKTTNELKYVFITVQTL